MAEINITGNTSQVAQDMESIKESAKEINEVSGSTSKTTEETSNKWTELNSKVELFKTGLGVAKDIGMQIYGVAKDLVMEYEKVNNQLTILKSQPAWGDIKIQMDAVEKSTGGVIDKLDILESVNKATSFGINLTNGRLLKLVDVSSKAAKTMGTDLKFAFDSLIVGTARESKLILDNLGVMVDLGKANDDYAASIGKTSKELTEEETKVALLNQVLSELDKTQKNIIDESLVTSGTGLFAKMERGWRDVKLWAGEALSYIATNINESTMDIRERAQKQLTQAIDDENTKRKEKVAESVKVISDIEGGLSDRRKKFLEETIRMEEEHINVSNQLAKESSIKQYASEYLKNLKIQDEGATEAMINKRKEEYLIEEIEQKFGKAAAARMQIEIENRKAIIEQQKKKGEIADDVEFNVQGFIDAQIKGMGDLVGKGADYVAYLNEMNRVMKLGEDPAENMTLRDRKSSTIDPEYQKQLDEQEIERKKKKADRENKLLERTIKENEQAQSIFIKNNERFDLIAAEKEEDELKRIQKTAYAKINALNDEKELYLATTMDTYQLRLAKEQEFDAAIVGISQKAADDMDKIDKDRLKSKEESDAEILEFIEDSAVEQKKKEKEWTDSANKDAIAVSKDKMAEAQRLQKMEFSEKMIAMKKEKAERERITEMSNAVLTGAAEQLHNDIIAGEEDMLQRMAATALKIAGSQIFADGLKRIWEGGGDMLKASNPALAAEGATQVGYGLLEVAAGTALGYAGNKMMPSTSSEAKSKETASKDRINNNSNDKRDKVNVYLYENEKYWTRTFNRSLNKVRGKK